jgi:hypothetical protein
VGIEVVVTVVLCMVVGIVVVETVVGIVVEGILVDGRVVVVNTVVDGTVVGLTPPQTLFTHFTPSAHSESQSHLSPTTQQETFSPQPEQPPVGQDLSAHPV